VFEATSKRWEIRGKDGGMLVHTPGGQETFPVGKNGWTLSDSTSLYLRLQQDVRMPGMFCCDTGLSVHSDVVCDGKPDCDDYSDEADCEMMIVSPYYNSDKPPVRLLRKKSITIVEPLDVELDLIILVVLDVNEVNYGIELIFLLVFTWYDQNLHFKYLKGNSNKNQVDSQLQQQVWTPKLRFYVENEDKGENYDDKLTVEKISSPKLVPAGYDPNQYFKEGISRNNTELDFDEVYAGEMNPFRLTTEKRKVFACSFFNMNYYPWRPMVFF